MKANGTESEATTYSAGGDDPINSPRHYTRRVPGVECIEVSQYFDFCLGNVIKYVWRAGLKGGPAKEIEDLRKAKFYLERRIAQLEAARGEG